MAGAGGRGTRACAHLWSEALWPHSWHLQQRRTCPLSHCPCLWLRWGQMHSGDWRGAVCVPAELCADGPQFRSSRGRGLQPLRTFPCASVCPGVILHRSCVMGSSLTPSCRGGSTGGKGHTILLLSAKLLPGWCPSSMAGLLGAAVGCRCVG